MLSRLAFWTTLLILAVYVVWMLALPCFPSQDGPAHLYYVHVLGQLPAHGDATYRHFFRLQHALPPYSLYYYALLLLGKVVPLLLADRLIICLYFVCFVLGFRYLALAIGAAGEWTTVGATLLLLNWSLGMGFVNFCLALALSLWGVGLWMRVLGQRAPARRCGFLLLATIVMLTHPVPVLLLVAVAGVLLAVRFVDAFDEKGHAAWPVAGKADALTLGLACLNLVYVKLFTIGHPLQQDPQAAAGAMSVGAAVAHRASAYAREYGVAFLLGKRLDIAMYRAGLLVLLAVPMALAVQQRLRNRKLGLWSSGDTFLVLGVAVLVGLPFFPAQLNGSYFFADRMVICIWLAFLLAASGWAPAQEAPAARKHERHQGDAGVVQLRPVWDAPVAWGVACVLLVCLLQAALLRASTRLLRPPAETILALERTPVTLSHQLGFLLEDPREPKGGAQEGLAWNPMYWALMHLLRRNEAVMANAPWSEVTILPVGPAPALPEMQIEALKEPLPTQVQAALLRSPEALRRTLASVDFFAVNAFDRPPQGEAEPLLQSVPGQASGWSCRTEGWYRVCRRSAQSGL